jgi:hypothetical protein
MWYKNQNIKLAWLGDPAPATTEESESEYATDPTEISNQPVALDVSPDVVGKAKQFASNGRPLFFSGQNGKKYLIIHGTPDGYFNTGDPAINNRDGNPMNDGFVKGEDLKQWLDSKGYGGNINIIACYGGKMEQINYSGGSAKSLFRNQGKLGLSTLQSPRGNKLVFQKS